ncbi:unnamed protein product [Malus baccata var. baccata]
MPRARARLQEGVAGSRNAALRAERLILSFPYLRAPLAAEDVGNGLQFLLSSVKHLARFFKLKSPKLNLFFENYRVEEVDGLNSFPLFNFIAICFSSYRSL